MKTSADNNGNGVHWGVSSTGLTGFSNLILNGTDQTVEADTETASDSNGYVVTEVTYNHKETATLETWVSGSTGSKTASITTTNIPQPGDKLTVTDSVNTAISGSSWIVGSSNIKRANNTFAKVSTSLKRFALIP